MAKKVVTKKVVELPKIVTVQPGTVVKEATKMDNLISSEKDCLIVLADIRNQKALHKAFLKAELEK